MRDAELLGIALLIAIGVIFVSIQAVRQFGAHPVSHDTQDDSSQFESKLVDDARFVAMPIASSYITPATLTRLEEAARLDDWRAIDAASAAAVAGR